MVKTGLADALRLAFMLLLALGAYGQPPLTTVNDTVYNTDGTTFNGNLQIQSQSFSTSGASILQQYKNLKIQHGVVNVGLVPNDTSVPPKTSYVFTFANGTVLNCVIPTSSSPITLAPHCTNSPPVPVLASVLLGQLNVIGVPNGNYCLVVSNGVITGLTTCSGGGGGAKTWSLMIGTWSQQSGPWSAQ